MLRQWFLHNIICIDYYTHIVKVQIISAAIMRERGKNCKKSFLSLTFDRIFLK